VVARAAAAAAAAAASVIYELTPKKLDTLGMALHFDT
jgi:hypothetical protein